MSADKRVETGPVVFGNDWTGLFIRGNDTFEYIKALKAVIKTVEQRGYGGDVGEAIKYLTSLKQLVKLLSSTDERIKTDRTVPKYYEMPKEK